MQPCEGLSHRQPTTARYVNDFGRRQGVYIYWILGLDGREEVFIVVNIQVRVEATLHQDPRPPKFQRLFYLGEYLLLPEEITVTRAGGTVEGAEVTLSQAEVGVVDVAVNNERNLLLRHRPPPLLHREGAKGKEIHAPNRADIQGQTRTSALRNNGSGQWYRRANSLKRPSPTLPYGYGCIQWRRPRLPPHPAGFRPQGLYPRPGPPTLHRPWAIPSTPAKRHPDRNEECQTPGSTWPLELRRL